jgi:hypothetical protein
MRSSYGIAWALAMSSGALAAPVAPAMAQAMAQAPERTIFAELRGGSMVPTFDIADVATSGTAIGATLGWVPEDSRWVLMAEFDYGGHEDEATGTVDINTLHYMGKLGYSLTGPRERGWEAVVNLGAGAVTFDVDGADARTYFAINAGAKLAYNFNPRFALVLSPQGDIAFTKKSELTTSNAWVWPFTAGLRLKL